MSAKSYQRGSNAIKSQIDIDLEAYLRRYNSGDPVAFLNNMRAALDEAKINNDLLEARVAALESTITKERQDHEAAIESEKRRVNHFKELALQYMDDVNKIAEKHNKLSALFRMVCSPERYQQLSREYDEEHKQ